MILIEGVKDDEKREEKREIITRSFLLHVRSKKLNNYQTVLSTKETHQLYICQVRFRYTNIMFLMKSIHWHQRQSAHYQQITLFATAHQIIV